MGTSTRDNMNLVVLALVLQGALAGNLVEELEKEPELSLFLEMVEKAGFLDTLKSEGALSVIAPMNSGFRTNVYETEGHTLHTFNGSPSLDERPASNGILHVVSDLVSPPLEYTIAENLKLDPRFSALNMAVEAAGLMDTVENEGPFPLFAPIDEAFDKLAGKTLGKKEATQIVNKHLVKGTI